MSRSSSTTSTVSSRPGNPDVVRGAIEACRLEAREPAGVRLGGSGDAVRAEKVAIGLASPIRPHHGALVRGSCAPHRSGSLRGGPQQRLGLAHLPSRRGVRTSKPLQLSPLPTRHLQSPSRSHHPTHNYNRSLFKRHIARCTPSAVPLRNATPSV